MRVSEELAEILIEAEARVKTWPDWKRSIDLFAEEEEHTVDKGSEGRG